MKSTSRYTCALVLTSLLVGYTWHLWLVKARTDRDSDRTQRWMNEVYAQAVPLPQMLYASPMNWAVEVETMDGRLHPEDSITSLNPYVAQINKMWTHFRAELLATAAVTQPPAVEAVFNEGRAYWFPFIGTPNLPVLDGAPKNEKHPVFFWLRKVRVPATVTPVVVLTSPLSEQDKAFLRMPKRVFGPVGECAHPFMPALYFNQP